MTVIVRLASLFVAIGGIALLIVDGLQSQPGLWYAVAGIVAGTLMIQYTAVLSSSRQRTQPTPEPASSGRSEESKRGSTTRQTDPTPAGTKQTAQSTESVEHEPELASENNRNPPELPTSEKSEIPSTAVKKPQHFSAKNQATQRKSSYTNSSRTRKTSRTSTHQQRHIASTATSKRNHATGIDNSYFKPVDSSSEIKFIQIDTRFSYIDVDWGPEFIGLDPFPDLIEVDIGPSAVSYDLVRSPVEIKISSFLKALLAPSPRSSGTTASNDSTRPSMATNNHARRETDDTATRRRSEPRDTYDTRYPEQDRRVEYHREPLTNTDRQQQPAETWLQSSGSETETHHPSTSDTTDYGSREEMGTYDGRRSNDRRSLGWEPVMDKEPIESQDMGVAGEPAVNVGMNYSPPERESPQWHSDPFGLTDVDLGVSEFEEPVMEPVEKPELGFGMSDWEPGLLIEEPVMDPEIGTEMLGLDGFAEPPEDAIGLPGRDVENRSNPLFPEVESFFPEEDAEDDWLTF